MPRPRHPIKELEAVLAAVEAQGWLVIKGKYFKMRCPCADKHAKTVHLTPSDPMYLKNLVNRLHRTTCFKKE
jgi:hypothetical protein